VCFNPKGDAADAARRSAMAELSAYIVVRREVNSCSVLE
jgi:hypothetical protein